MFLRIWTNVGQGPRVISESGMSVEVVGMNNHILRRP